MTPDQIALARHALGLPNEKQVSYRNRFYVSAGGADFLNWKAMERSGDAIRSEDEPRHFELTRTGAAAALLPGESLDPEDFPRETQS